MKENMTHDDMKTYLRDQGLNPVSEIDKSTLMVSSKLIRCQDAEPMLVAMGSDRSKAEQINALVDAVHLYLQTIGTTGNLRLVLGKKNDKKVMAEIISAITLMIESLKIPLKVDLQIDFTRSDYSASQFTGIEKVQRWMSFLTDRDKKEPPKLARKLSELVDDDSFRWYQSVTGTEWSGRVEGLQVCTVRPDSDKILLGVGKPGKNGNGRARKEYLNILNQKQGDTETSEVKRVVGIIQRYSEISQRRKAERLSKRTFPGKSGAKRGRGSQG